jgi:hypothetical protein
MGDRPPDSLRLPGIEPQPFIRAAALLLEAHRLALDLGCDPWEFAVEIGELRATGLTNNALRWLLHKGYVRHAAEVYDQGIQGRTFRSADGLCFDAAICFMLTEAGLSFAEARVVSSSARPAEYSSPGPARGILPVWDPDRQELRVGGTVVKRFKVPAPNQEIVLASFQEEGWPVRIDDPLPPMAGLEPKRRLHETITSLNRNHKRRLIHFHGDGSGQGVLWEPSVGFATRSA